jgi:hypothetical protein
MNREGVSMRENIAWMTPPQEWLGTIKAVERLKAAAPGHHVAGRWGILIKLG